MKKLTIPGRSEEFAPVLLGTAMPKLMDPPNMFGPPPDRTEQFRLLDEVWDTGIRAFDCAAHYGEPVIGEYLAARGRRNEAVLLTKCCHPNQYRKRVTSFDMLSDLHDSLIKLKTDRIDIYLLHRDDPSVPVAEIVEPMNELIRQGKILSYGGSNWSAARVREANEYAAAHGLVPFQWSSPSYSLAEQVGVSWDDTCETISGKVHAADRTWYQENNIPIIAYSSLARGFFSGRFKSGEPQKAEELLDGVAKSSYLAPENFERLRRAELLAEQYHVTPAQIALAFLFSQGFSVYPVISGSSARRYTDALAAAELTLSEQELRWLDLEADHC